MQPNQSSQPHVPVGPGPQPPYHPQEYTVDPNVQSDRPTYGSNTLHQHPSGQYEVVPPLPANPSAGATGHNPYEFIMAPRATPKRTLLNASSLLVRVGIVLAGATLLVILVVVAFSVFTPKGSTPGLTEAAERQQEIVRIGTAAAAKVSGQEATNFVTNVNVSVFSCKQQVVGYLAAHGAKIDKKTIALYQDSRTDALLANALSAGNYDTVATQTLATQLQTYQNLLSTTYKQTNNKQAKQLIQDCYTSANNLLKQYRSFSTNS